MTDLLTHFKAMQAAMTEFMAPDVYIAKTDGKGYKAGARFAHRSEGVAEALLNDVIHMLDGPEQRAAEFSYTNMVDKVKSLEADKAAMQADIGQIRERASNYRNERDEAVKARDEGRAENTSLRQDVARLSGMLDMLREIGAIPQASGSVVNSIPNTDPYGNPYAPWRQR